MKIGTRTRALNGYYMLLVLLVFMFLAGHQVSAQGAAISGEVTEKATGNPIENAQVTVTYEENGTVFTTTHTDPSGNFQVTGLSAGTYNVSILAMGFRMYYEDIMVEDSSAFGEETYFIDAKLDPEQTLGIIPHVEDDEETSQPPYQIVVVIIIILIISIIMYSKIKRENLLKNALRKRIYDYIKENPGFHYRAILADLDLPMGVLTYHLNRLEKARYIKSKQDGMFRRFYVSGRKTDMRFFLSDIQLSILNVIKEHRGISQSKIAEKISVSRKVVNYHINILNKAGLILVESHGRETACYPVEVKPSDN